MANPEASRCLAHATCFAGGDERLQCVERRAATFHKSSALCANRKLPWIVDREVLHHVESHGLRRPLRLGGDHQPPTRASFVAWRDVHGAGRIQATSSMRASDGRLYQKTSLDQSIA